VASIVNCFADRQPVRPAVPLVQTMPGFPPAGDDIIRVVRDNPLELRNSGGRCIGHADPPGLGAATRRYFRKNFFDGGGALGAVRPLTQPAEVILCAWRVSFDLEA